MVRTTYLELTSIDQLRPSGRPAGAVELVRAELPSPEFNRYLYRSVGGDHYWRDRIKWTWDRWRRQLESSSYETWYLTVQGTPAGYVELEAGDLPNVELVCFGLIPSFIGRGLGGWMLDQATRRALTIGSRAWLHTCTLDGPSALPAYLRRGYRVFRVVDAPMDLPDDPPGPWTGAERARSVAQ